jgi:hypothetical protein
VVELQYAIPAQILSVVVVGPMSWYSELVQALRGRHTLSIPPAPVLLMYELEGQSVLTVQLRSEYSVALVLRYSDAEHTDSGEQIRSDVSVSLVEM